MPRQIRGDRPPVQSPAVTSAGKGAGGAAGAMTRASGRERRDRRLRAQYRVTKILADASSFREAAPQILETVCEGLDWRLGQVWRVDQEEDALVFVGAWHAGSRELEEFVSSNRDVKFARGEGLPGRVWATGIAAWIDDVTEDPNFPRAELAARAELHAGF